MLTILHKAADLWERKSHSSGESKPIEVKRPLRTKKQTKNRREIYRRACMALKEHTSCIPQGNGAKQSSFLKALVRSQYFGQEVNYGEKTKRRVRKTRPRLGKKNPPPQKKVTSETSLSTACSTDAELGSSHSQAEIGTSESNMISSKQKILH